MAPSDRPRLLELLLALASTFGREADEALFFGYEMALDDLPIDRIEAGIRNAIRQCKFMPSGAELRELAGDVKDTDRSVLAFAALSKAVQKHGYYESVSFDDPLINAAVNNLGGWERICTIEDQEEWEKWFRKEFERVYTSLCRTGASPEACSPLIGFFNRDNGLKGYERKQPLLIATGLPPHRPGLVYNGKLRPGIAQDIPRVEFKKPDGDTPPPCNPRG